MSKPVLQLISVSQYYRHVKALDHVDLMVPAGCVAGLIGPDGVGKSTLLGLAAGVRRVQSGRVEVLGGDVSQRAHRRLMHDRISYMPQGLGRNLYPTLTVEENLDFFARLFGQGIKQRYARITELLSAIELLPFRDRAVGKLSGGMKQKLGICAALLHDPDLMILDEPTTGVDPLSRRQFWGLIEEIRELRPEISVLVATAYMEEAQQFDWLAAMQGGRVLATGTPQEIMGKVGRRTLESAFIALMSPGLQNDEGSIKSTACPPAPSGAPAIEAEGLTRRFKEFVAVDHVSFRIEKGEIFGFLGSNGSGKTTTMKMLAGLLPASAGTSKIFGKELKAGDLETRRRIGYMSQAFSLYGELTVRQNLSLHARLFSIPATETEARVKEMLSQYDLKEFGHQRPVNLPLGIRQRLQLAAAVLPRPEILILDEPTSGVDPIARDAFWRSLIVLSRKDKVTIFLSTHFMNEAERCDRISLMHSGKVLDIGTPESLRLHYGKASLEETFIEALSQTSMGTRELPVRRAVSIEHSRHAQRRYFDPRRLWAFAWREILEIIRDKARMSFALGGPVLLMLTFAYGISFDVEHLPFAVYDQDQSAQSRQLIEGIEGSRYFEERRPISEPFEMQTRLQSGELRLAIEIPPDFGRDVMQGGRPQVSVFLDGAMPFRAETTRGYIAGLADDYLADAQARQTGRRPQSPFTIENRFRYNQDFKSVNAIVPSVIALMLVLIPAITTALAIVREKETGTITNFHCGPSTRVEFMLGKQLPYVAIASISFFTLLCLTRFVFAVPIKGSIPLLIAGSVLYVFATTAFGLLISSFVRSQVAAVFATAIITMIPAINFSGLLAPVSSLTGAGWLMGLLFPASWYQAISVGVITKGLGLADLWPNFVVLAIFGVAFVAAAMATLPKMER